MTQATTKGYSPIKEYGVKYALINLRWLKSYCSRNSFPAKVSRCKTNNSEKSKVNLQLFLSAVALDLINFIDMNDFTLIRSGGVKSTIFVSSLFETLRDIKNGRHFSMLRSEKRKYVY